MGCTPGSQRLHASVISRRLNLILCTRHQYKYTYHIAGCRHHHEFILLSRRISSMAEQPFCKRQVVGSSPTSGSTVPVHTGASWLPAPVKSGLRGGQSLRQISGWHKLAERFCSGPTPRCKAMAEQRHTASKLFRLHLRAGNSPPLPGSKPFLRQS